MTAYWCKRRGTRLALAGRSFSKLGQSGAVNTGKCYPAPIKLDPPHQTYFTSRQLFPADVFFSKSPNLSSLFCPLLNSSPLNVKKCDIVE